MWLVRLKQTNLHQSEQWLAELSQLLSSLQGLHCLCGEKLKRMAYFYIFFCVQPSFYIIWIIGNATESVTLPKKFEIIWWGIILMSLNINMYLLYQYIFPPFHLRGNTKRKRFQLDVLSPKKEESNKSLHESAHTTTTGMVDKLVLFKVCCNALCIKI